MEINLNYNMSNRNKGVFLALASAVLSGTIPIFGKITVTIFSPIFVTFVIPAIVAVLLGQIAILKKEVVKNLAKKNALWILVIGFFAALGSLFSFHGLSIGRASDAGFLLQFEVLFASILAFIFLKEKLSLSQIIGLFLMILGGFAITIEKTFSFSTANILFLMTSFVWAINTVIVKRQVKNFSPTFLAYGRYFVSSIILFSFSVSSFGENIKKITLPNAFLLLSYGLVIVGLILLLYNALKYVKTAEAISCQLLSPILTALISFFFLKESLEIGRIVAGGIVLIGLFLMIQKKAFRFL